MFCSTPGVYRRQQLPASQPKRGDNQKWLRICQMSLEGKIMPLLSVTTLESLSLIGF